MELTEIHFIAQMVNAEKSKDQGYAMPTLWGTLRKDLQEKYLRDARDMVELFKKRELEAEENRIMHIPTGGEWEFETKFKVTPKGTEL